MVLLGLAASAGLPSGWLFAAARGRGDLAGPRLAAMAAACVASAMLPAAAMAEAGPPAGQPRTVAAGLHGAPRVTFLGDSITAAGDWQRRFPDVALTNAGRPGDTTLDLLARLGPVRESRPQLVLLMVGINDLLRGARERAVAERIALIRQHLANQGRVRVIQQSTLSCEASRCGAPMVARVRRLNQLLRAGVTAADFLDVDAVLSDASGLRPTYSLDGLHLTAAAYNRWQGLLKARFGRQLGRSIPVP